MSDLRQTGFPDDTDDIDDPPRSRRRTALVVVAIVCVIAAGVAVGLVLGLPDDSAENTPIIDIAQEPEQVATLSLPPGCELLTPGQLGGLVPGKPTKAGRGPEVVVDATESACDWALAEADPDDPRAEPAALSVKATAAPDEEAARSTMKISLPCQGSRHKAIEVSGADEGCLDHKAAKADGSADVTVVSARFQSLVVEVSYRRPTWPAWRVDDQTSVTAAALIGRIVRSQ